MASDRAENQASVEGDPQATLHGAIRCRHAETRDHQLGIFFQLRRKRQCPIEPVSAKTTVECRLSLGEIRNIRGEPQAVDLCPTRGDIATLDLARQPQSVEHSLRCKSSRNRARYLGPERGAE